MFLYPLHSRYCILFWVLSKDVGGFFLELLKNISSVVEIFYSFIFYSSSKTSWTIWWARQSVHQFHCPHPQHLLQHFWFWRQLQIPFLLWNCNSYMINECTISLTFMVSISLLSSMEVTLEWNQSGKDMWIFFTILLFEYFVPKVYAKLVVTECGIKFTELFIFSHWQLFKL